MTAMEAGTAAAPVGAAPPLVMPSVLVGSGGVRFLGNERAYWRLMIRGAVLLMVTLGIYRFWLATDMRRFLWANTEIAGDALEYTGTARELLVGFLIAVAVLVPVYTGFFIAGFSVLGQFSAVIGFVALTLFGHFAVYRARRYRLTRTIFRGVRLHQSGSAWRYAFCALLWWTLIVLTLGLVYPWAQASLERYKMRNTFYGDLAGHFIGSGTWLFLRGVLLWLVVLGPLLAGIFIAAVTINWTTVADAVGKGGDNVLGRIESANPSFTPAAGFAVIAAIWAVLAAALLYPAFQAMVLRWWMSGVRFGEVTVTSRLRTGQMYGVYLRFVGISMLFALVASMVSTVALVIFGSSFQAIGKETAGIVAAAGALVTYVVIMLGYSTIYQVTVKLRLWSVSFESMQFSGLQALDNVKARGAAASPFGEGLADALNVGGL